MTEETIKQAEPTGKTVMIVDDEMDSIEVVKTILGQNGYKVIQAINGDDCLKQLAEGANPDLILLDIMMPGTPVKEVVDQIGDKYIEGMKLAYISAVDLSDAKKDGLMNENIREFIQKPYDIDNLLDVVRKLIG